MTAVGDIKGMLVCTRYEPPFAPSRWCQWLGHSDTITTGRRGGRIEYRRYECERCGRNEVWWDRRDYRIPEMLGRKGFSAEQIAAIRGRA